jgi:hypothetical protein
MVRTRVKGNGMKAASSPDTEPNFYAMEPCEDHEPDRDTNRIMMESDMIMTNTESSTSSSSRRSISASAMFPSLEQAVAVELDEIYSNDEVAVTLKARPEDDMMDVMEPDEDEGATGGCSSSCSIMPHVSFSSDFPMMDLVSSMPFPSSSLAIVSPPESPNLNAKKSFLTKASIHDIVESALNVSDDFDMLDFPAFPLHLPHSGDAVFFEGLKFRYLDHLDLVTNHVSDDDNNGEDVPGATASV